MVLQHLAHHALPVGFQLADPVLHHALALQAHGEVVVELPQLVAVQVRFARPRDQPEELEAHVRRVVRVVRADLLREPVPPHRQRYPLHDVVGVAGAPDAVAVGAADGFRALQGFRVVAQEVGLGALGKGFEELGFLGKDFDDGWVEVVRSEGGLDLRAVEAAGTVDQRLFPEGLAAQAEGEVEPRSGVRGDAAVEDLAEGEKRRFDWASDDRWLRWHVSFLFVIIQGDGRIRLRC